MQNFVKVKSEAGLSLICFNRDHSQDHINEIQDLAPLRPTSSGGNTIFEISHMHSVVFHKPQLAHIIA